MVTNDTIQHRKREFVIIKYGQTYYYARASYTDNIMYQIVVPCSEKEARSIVESANNQSMLNRDIDKVYDDAETEG